MRVISKHGQELKKSLPVTLLLSHANNMEQSSFEMVGKNSKKTVVVGAGPVGALAALYAATRGDQVEVYELRDGMCLYLTSFLSYSVFLFGCEYHSCLFSSCIAAFLGWDYMLDRVLLTDFQIFEDTALHLSTSPSP